jgi:hypothetical protein
MSQIKQRIMNDAYVFQGVNHVVLNISAKNSADIDQLGKRNWVNSQNNWDNTATQKQVGNDKQLQ